MTAEYAPQEWEGEQDSEQKNGGILEPPRCCGPRPGDKLPWLVMSADFLPFQRVRRKGLGVLRVYGLNFAAKLCQVPLGLFQFGATYARSLSFSV